MAVEQREAFLFEPDWDGPWEETVQDYVEAFQPGDPVALLIALDPARPGQLPEDEAGRRVLALLARLGREQVAPIMVLSPAELAAELGRFTRARWAPPRRPNRFLHLTAPVGAA